MSMGLDASFNSIEAERVRPAVRRDPRVLIVDDVAENRSTLGLYCDRLGVLHEAVESGYEAVQAVQSGRFDVILMDIFMPGMDGMIATRAIRALPGPVSAVPIVAVTTAASPGEVLRYLDCGMTDVVPKPINASHLAEALSTALSQASRDTRPSRREAVEHGLRRH